MYRKLIVTLSAAVLTAGCAVSQAAVMRPPTCRPSGHYSCSPSPVPTGTSPSPSPTITSPSPSPTTTSPSPSPTTTSPSCTIGIGGTCGAYDYADQLNPDGYDTNSNGFNTYVFDQGNGQQPGTTGTLTAVDPGNWTANINAMPVGYTGVQNEPGSQQQFDNWCPATGTWDNLLPCPNGGPLADTPISALGELQGTYSESFPHDAGTVAQYAWDIWIGGNNTGFNNENMVWVDNVNRGTGGADILCGGSGQPACPVINGQAWTFMNFGGGENIWSLGARGTFAQQSSGTVDLLALLHWEQANGFMSPTATIGLVVNTWEICSTTGTEPFTVNHYSLVAG